MMNVQHETRNQVWASLLSGDPELFPEVKRITLLQQPETLHHEPAPERILPVLSYSDSQPNTS